MAPRTERATKRAVDKTEFEQRLRLAGLTKIRFSELTGLRRTTVLHWNLIGAPAWTVSWLMLFRRADRKARGAVEDWADFKPPR